VQCTRAKNAPALIGRLVCNHVILQTHTMRLCHSLASFAAGTCCAVNSLSHIKVTLHIYKLASAPLFNNKHGMEIARISSRFISNDDARSYIYFIYRLAGEKCVRDELKSATAMSHFYSASVQFHREQFDSPTCAFCNRRKRIKTKQI